MTCRGAASTLHAGRRVPAGTSNAKLILAKAKASASEEANVIEERPATPLVHVPESELVKLVQALSQDDYQAKTAAAKVKLFAVHFVNCNFEKCSKPTVC